MSLYEHDRECPGKVISAEATGPVVGRTTAIGGSAWTFGVERAVPGQRVDRRASMANSPNRTHLTFVRNGMRQIPSVAAEIEDVTVAAAKSGDEALVARARRGDRDAFALLIEPRVHRLSRTARAILGNDTDAHEAAQEALIASWISLPRLRDVDRFDAWLNRTLVNKCRDAIRRRNRVREIDITDAGLSLPDLSEAQAAQAAVLAAFDRLSVDERHVLVLHHLHDLQLAQIAAHLGVPLGTAKSRMWSARRALERALEAEA